MVNDVGAACVEREKGNYGKWLDERAWPKIRRSVYIADASRQSQGPNSQ